MQTTPTPEPTLPTPPEALLAEAPTLVPAALPPAAARVDHRPAPLAAGQVLGGRFALERRLGAGGLAEVWAARDLHLGQDVAIKALHGHLAGDTALVERFRRELAITRDLDHPGVVKVYDFHAGGGRPFFALELLRGRSLAQRLAEGPVPREEALRIARDAAAALQAAHRRGVVHRDLKPHNLFLAEDPHDPSAPPRVVLLDFGLARAAGLSRMTATSTVLGTPGYIAPEVFAGQGLDGRADLYALGAVLFELLAGKRAFSSVDPQAVLAQKAAPPRLEDALPGASKADAALVARLLAPDPEQRFLDAGQVLRALGGSEVGPLPEAPPALTAGAFDVVVRRGIGLGLAAGRALERVRQRLGLARPALGWRARLWLSGENRLVAGASQASAERVAAICREEGLGAQVTPAKPEGLLARSAQRAGAIGLGLFGLAAIERLFQGLHDVGGLWRWYAGALQTARGQDLEKFKALLANHPEYLNLSHWILNALGAAVPSVLLGGAAAALAAGCLSLFAPAPAGAARGRGQGGVAGALLLAVGAAVLLRLQTGLLPVPEETWAVFNLFSLSAWDSPPFTQLLLPRSLSGLAAGLSGAQWFSHGGHQPVLDLSSLSTLAAMAAALFAGLRAKVADPVPLPSGDPVVRRLAAGIGRRLASLRAWVNSAPPAEQEVARALLAAAEEVSRPAPALAEAAALADDRRAQAGAPQPSQPADALDQQRDAASEQRRDVAVDHLLRIASSLDDALAALTAPAADAARRDASAPLRRLQEELAPPAAAEPAGRTPVDPLRTRARS